MTDQYRNYRVDTHTIDGSGEFTWEAHGLHAACSVIDEMKIVYPSSEEAIAAAHTAIDLRLDRPKLPERYDEMRQILHAGNASSEVQADVLKYIEHLLSTRESVIEANHSLAEHRDEMRIELAKVKLDAKTKREHMPDTRSSKTGKSSVGNIEYYVTIGFYDDEDRDIARPGEMFIKMSKHGSDISLMYDALATMISVSLQYGVPWSKIKEKFEHTRGSTFDHINPSILHGIVMTADKLISEYRSETQSMTDDVPMKGA